ncbi:OmpA family protein [Leptospirillum ferrooxidans]|jgi:peptidoglycan-associated lipoprotein|uniref:Putative outer membrane protein, OmpA/MotB family n=1 Tax=Leptospirillum ferrooxidans (strain C2-3) TaxID=1162668 RepID=I0IKX5_LEPFC|nr:OmpA family protein [Leptospirillum ferrooxidans]BAM05924.1 putative outer membrane protein, OmpA/MotB family [Leptospirillum ferrooxidans C2-3]
MNSKKSLLAMSILVAGILVAGGCSSTGGSSTSTPAAETQNTAPAPAPAATESAAQTAQDEVNQTLSKDITYGFDKAVLTASDRESLKKDAKVLNANPSVKVVIAGHADERGTDTYNIVLGQKRAKAAMMYLVHMGISKKRIKIVSYGKRSIPGYDTCSDHTESCWQANRIAHFMKITM